jgi:hypothetical protein
MKTYTGGCHCGKVRYEAEMELSQVIECNCSHCAAKGLLLIFIPAEQFTLLAGEDALTEYRFNKKVIRHLFCSTCGVEAFGKGKGQSGNEMVAINIRSFDDLDLTTINRTLFDGKSL